MVSASAQHPARSKRHRDDKKARNLSRFLVDYSKYSYRPEHRRGSTEEVFLGRALGLESALGWHLDKSLSHPRRWPRYNTHFDRLLCKRTKDESIAYTGDRTESSPQKSAGNRTMLKMDPL